MISNNYTWIVDSLYVKSKTKNEAIIELRKMTKSNPNRIKIKLRRYVCRECGCEKGYHYGECSKACVI